MLDQNHPYKLSAYALGAIFTSFVPVRMALHGDGCRYYLCGTVAHTKRDVRNNTNRRQIIRTPKAGCGMQSELHLNKITRDHKMMLTLTLIQIVKNCFNVGE